MLLGIFLFVTHLQVNAQSWTAQSSVTINQLNSVLFTNSIHGFAVGSSGSILTTNDGGTSWSTQNSGTINSLTCAYFKSPSLGWAVGLAGTILKTSDGGTTWTAQTSGTSNNLSSVCFTSDMKGFAVGAKGTILATSNGGSTWTAPTSGTSNQLYSIYFTSDLLGWAVGLAGTILKTSDGGTTWVSQTNENSNNLSNVYFTSDTNGFAVGSSGTILATTNGGSIWSAQNSGVSENLRSTFFVSDTKGWAVGLKGTILKTSDGGTSWTPQTIVTTTNLTSAYFLSSTKGWAVGQNGTILSYVDTSSTDPTPTITTQPQSLSVCENSIVSASVEANGSNLLYQWQNSTDSGSTWSDVKNETGTTSTLSSIVGVTLAQNNSQYRVIVSSKSGFFVISNVVTLTVMPTPTITTQPTSAAFCEGSVASVSVLAEGANLTYQWELSTNNGKSWNSIANETTSAFSSAGSVNAPWNGYQFRVVVSNNLGCSVISDVVTFTKNKPPTITTQPINVTICENSIGSLSVVTAGTRKIDILTYQWQESADDGDNWSDVGNETGTTSTLTSIVPLALNGYKFHVVITNDSGCSVTSDAATLTVTPISTITLTSATGTDAQTLCSASTITPITYSLAGATGATVSGLPDGVTALTTSNSVVDQSQVNFNEGLVGTDLWQSFTAGQTGQLSQIELFKTAYYSFGTGSIKIYQGTGTDGVLLNTTDISNNPTANELIITLSSSVNVVAGNVYTFQIVATNNSNYNLIAQNKNPYSGGVSSYNIDFDLWFKTYVSGGTNMVSITGSPTQSGNYTYSVSSSGSCGSISIAGTITVNPNITSTFTQVASICSGAFMADLPTTSDESITGVWSPALNNTATTMYTFTPTAGQCATTATMTITVNTTNSWIGGTNTLWNVASNWSCGVVPSQNSDVVITTGSYQPEVTASTTIASITVNSNATVLVQSGVNLTVTNAITTAANGTFTIQNNANLIQTNDVSNSGEIIIKRQTSALMRSDYVLWSSPVEAQKLQSFSAATLNTRFYTYNPLSDKYSLVATPSTTNFATGTGYLIRLPNTHPSSPTLWEGQFQGVPNNGNLTLSGLTTGTYNAIGNPYPSTIDANLFRTTNGITEALYFWRKTNSNTQGTAYATYTSGGGVASSSGEAPNGTIQVGQGFIVKTTSNSIFFTNAMRTATNSNQFFKTKTIEKNRIWLNLSSAGNRINQMMVGYITDATAGVDAGLDGKYINDNPTALTSTINDEEFVIQAKGLPFDAGDVVPLSFKTDAAGNFTIALDHFDGLFSTGQNIFLKDTATGTEQDLKLDSYTFNSAVGNFNSRFQLTYKSSKTLGTNQAVFDDNSIVVYKQNGHININAGKTILKNVKVFDMLGKLILEQKAINAATITLKNLTIAQQTVLVQMTSDENKVVTKKVIY